MKKLAVEALVLMAGLFCVCAFSRAAAASSCDDLLLQKIPPRPATALSGSQFARTIERLNGLDRERDIEAQVLAGNIPRFLRKLVPVFMRGERADGQRVEITACVLPDYLAVGSNRDFLFVPTRLSTALRIAGHYNFTLPTSKLVDAIYEQAAIRLAPQPLPAGDRMRSTDYYLHHNELISEQMTQLGAIPGRLTSGHMKDLVITNRLWRFPQRVAIYGWHRGVHDPIQPLSTVHGGRYVDYSHGVRLVSDVIYVNGKSTSIFQALTDPSLARVLNAEGPIPHVNDLIGKLEWLKLDFGLPAGDFVGMANGRW